MTSPSITDVIEFARSKAACGEALAWLKTQDDPKHAWQTCERPDWMIWLAGRRNIDRKVLVKIACDCARTALRFVPEGEDRPRLAIETTERWIVGEATIEEVRSARNAAADAAYAAYAYAAAYAAADAAYAADAADAAYAADAAAYAADAADARKEANIKMCSIVRQRITFKDLGFVPSVVYARPVEIAEPIFVAQPVAPATIKDISSEGPGILFSRDADRLESSNLLEALHGHILDARAAETATAFSASVQRAWVALSALCDAGLTCRCGGVLDRLTGACAECEEKREQLDADFRRIAVTAAHREEGIPF